MKFGSLFSGIGGFDLGFEQSGLSCSWQVEIDKDCQRVLQRHWPNVKRYEDVSTIGKLESVDVICGGFPCQDLSVAGKRAGLAGKRSGLWFEFLRIIGLNRPRWIVIENVPGLLSSDEHRDFAAILRGLVECGYCLAWRVLDAQFYGVAQRRRRVFIVGSLGDGSGAEILFESESVSWNPPTRREAGERVAGVAETSPTLGSSNFKPTKSTSGAQADLCIPVGAHRMTAFGEYVDDDSASALKQRDGGQVAIAFAENQRGEVRTSDISPQLSCSGGKPGSGYPAVAFHENKSGQLSEAEVLGVRAGASHSYQGVGGSFGVRRLTPTECERLQGFPDDWTLYDANGKEISDSARYRMLGNAVVRPVALFLGTRLRMSFDQQLEQRRAGVLT